MEKTDAEIEKLRELICKGLELSFQKLLIQKKAQNGIFIFSENGEIKKVRASDIK
jgi:hypothetical protein